MNWKIIPAVFFLAACSFGPGNFQSRQSTDLEHRRIKRIAVVPPSVALSSEKPKLPYGAVGPAAETAGSERQAPQILARLLYSSMAALSGWQMVSDLEVRDASHEVQPDNEALRAKQVGQIVFADAVITGRVLRFRERVGGELGAKSPASVSFVVDLWDVKRGDLIWSARFEETQKALSENLFAIGDVTQRGVKWLNAEELTHEGVKKAVKQLHQALYRTPA